MFLGDYRIEIIPDTEFRLDGGAMFGVVPRVLWEKKCPPDELNRITLDMNCLFVETPTEKILVETGIGEKWTEKQTAIYGIFREKSFAQTLFEKTNYKPEDITIVVNTHLHFDHAGGNTIWKSEMNQSKNQKPKTKDQKPLPQFPNARYFVSKSEYEHAENPHERDRASYLNGKLATCFGKRADGIKAGRIRGCRRFDDADDSRSFGNDADGLFKTRRENSLRFCRSDPDALPSAECLDYGLRSFSDRDFAGEKNFDSESD